MHARSVNVLTSNQEKYYKTQHFIETLRAEGLELCDTPGGSILDSSLIIQTKLKQYSIKVVECGNYKQIYYYDKTRYKSENIVFDDSDLIKKEKYITIEELEENKKSREEKKKIIEEKNITRTRIELERLTKTNITEFKTFLTLTFDTNKNDDININDIAQANKKFNIFKTYIKRLKNDFMYICVPEFQKRGAVHYHLLTNLDYNTSPLLLQEIKTWNTKSRSYKIGKPIRGWKYGYSMAIDLKDINVVGYISKYMTKDIDNRLFGYRRYHYSRNLKKPCETYIDLNNKKDVLYFLKSLNDMNIVYKNDYYDRFGNEIKFFEYSI